MTSVAAYAGRAAPSAPGATQIGQRARGVVSLHLRTLAREGRMTVTIGRRELLAAVGGAAAAWPLAARAQQTTKSRKVGVLHPGDSTTVNMRVAAIREGLNDPDNRSGSSPDIIVRLADGD